jgi:hypothetical protein
MRVIVVQVRRVNGYTVETLVVASLRPLVRTLADISRRYALTLSPLTDAQRSSIQSGHDYDTMVDNDGDPRSGYVSVTCRSVLS